MISTGRRESVPRKHTKPLMTSITKSATLVCRGQRKDRESKWDEREAGCPVYAIRPSLRIVSLFNVVNIIVTLCNLTLCLVARYRCAV